MPRPGKVGIVLVAAGGLLLLLTWLVVSAPCNDTATCARQYGGSLVVGILLLVAGTLSIVRSRRAASRRAP